MCDVSHANDTSFYKTIEELSVKVCVTHRN
ncbi:hypothetical protein [Candidatus Coxiella mudrowiae]